MFKIEAIASKKNDSKFKNILKVRGMGQVLTVTVGLIILCVVFSGINKDFFSGRNISNLLRQIAPVLLIGIGQSFVLITGNIDLSIGSVIGMSCMISATLMTRGISPIIAVILTLFCSLLVGAINGTLVSICKLPPFIATLGTMTISRGIAQFVNGNYNTDSIGKGTSLELFRNIFYYGKIFKLNNFVLYAPVLITILIWIIFNFVLSKTRTGRHTYAIGSNIEAARLSGVNTVATTLKVYMISAFCACLVGFITTASSGMGTMDAGTGYEMYAVASSVIGGVSTLGGQGVLLGTVIGASIWGVLQNGLQFADAPVAIRNIVIGLIVIVSVLLDVIVRSGKFRKKAS